MSDSTRWLGNRQSRIGQVIDGMATLGRLFNLLWA